MTDPAQAVEPSTGGARRRLWIAGGVAAAVAALAAVIWIAAPEPAFEMWGAVRLDSEGAFSMNPECGGKDSYDDINPGAPVTVYDGTGKALAKGTLDKGKFEGKDLLAPCVFTFSVVNVPGGLDSYQVEVSHRGRVSVSSAEAKSLVVLSLG